MKCMSLEAHVTTFIMYAIPVYIVAFILYIIRALKGPSISDIVLAIDALTYDLAAFLVILSILFRAPILTAIVLALWVYALDIYVAKYLEARELGE